MALSFIRARVSPRRNSLLRSFANVSTMKVITRNVLLADRFSSSTKRIWLLETKKSAIFSSGFGKMSVPRPNVLDAICRLSARVRNIFEHEFFFFPPPLPPRGENDDRRQCQRIERRLNRRFDVRIFNVPYSSIGIRKREILEHILVAHFLTTQLWHVFFSQGLVLGVYETESESNVVFTPTAAKFNELINGKLLKNILL